MDWKKFWAPMRPKRTKEQKRTLTWPQYFAACGILPCCLFAKEIGNFWACAGLFGVWCLIVYFVYLVYLYNKK